MFCSAGKHAGYTSFRKTDWQKVNAAMLSVDVSWHENTAGVEIIGIWQVNTMHSRFTGTPHYVLSIFTNGMHHTVCCSNVVTRAVRTSFRAYVMTPWTIKSANYYQLSIGWVASSGETLTFNACLFNWFHLCCQEYSRNIASNTWKTAQGGGVFMHVKINRHTTVCAADVFVPAE